jgi:hypothetical protein
MSLDYVFHTIDLGIYRTEVDPAFGSHQVSGTTGEVVRLIERALRQFQANRDSWQTEYSEADFQQVLESLDEPGQSDRPWPGLMGAESAMLAKAQGLIVESLVGLRDVDGALLQLEFGRTHLAARLVSSSVWVAEQFQDGTSLTGGHLKFFGSTEARRLLGGRS